MNPVYLDPASHHFTFRYPMRSGGPISVPRVLLQCLCAFVVVAGVSSHVLAQGATGKLSDGNGMDLRLFRASMDSKGLLSTNGAEVLSQGNVSFGLILDGGFGLLDVEGFENDQTVSGADAVRTKRLVDYSFTGTFLVNYGVLEGWMVGLQLPIRVLAGDNITVPGAYNDDPDGLGNGLDYQGLGDVTLHSKLRLVRPRSEDYGFGLAALVQLEVPTADGASFAGDGWAVWPTLALEYRFLRRLRAVANVGYRAVMGADNATVPVQSRTEPQGALGTGETALNPQLVRAGTAVTYGSLWTAQLGLGARLGHSLEASAEIYATQLADQGGDAAATSLEGLLGLKIFVEDSSYLTLGAGAGLAQGFQEPDARIVLGFVYEPPHTDTDGDGIIDSRDLCPLKAEDKDGFEDRDGCPDDDNDGDGILDRDDRCPMVEEDYDGDEDEDGCPEGVEVDRDGDGILDVNDRCPDDPEDRDGFEDEDGCPDLDNDQDGIPDSDDLCPNRAEDRDGFKDEDGCPDLDNDRDRIADAQDECPDDPETYNGKDDADGCPDQGSVVVEGDRLRILEKIYFETNSAVIQERSFRILDEVAGTLIGNPHILVVEVQGHADERGAAQHNLELTQARADSVRDSLIERNVSASRLQSRGYGELCPVERSSTPAAWEKNRRVEFRIVQTTTGTVTTELSCAAARRLRR